MLIPLTCIFKPDYFCIDFSNTKARNSSPNAACKYYKVLDLSEKNCSSKKKARRQDKLSYHKSSKSNYFTNIQEKYSSKNKHETVDQRPQNLKKLVTAPKTYVQNRTECLVNKITSTAAKFGMSIKGKRNNKLNKPVTCRVASTLKNKTCRKDRNYDSVDKGFNNTTHSTLKSNRSMKTYL
jgi:hypothetical protein